MDCWIKNWACLWHHYRSLGLWRVAAMASGLATRIYISRQIGRSETPRKRTLYWQWGQYCFEMPIVWVRFWRFIQQLPLWMCSGLTATLVTPHVQLGGSCWGTKTWGTNWWIFLGELCRWWILRTRWVFTYFYGNSAWSCGLGKGRRVKSYDVVAFQLTSRGITTVPWQSRSSCF